MEKPDAAQFVKKQAQKYPQFATYYERFEDLYTRKLYHQLTKALYEFIFNDDAFMDDNMIKLYLNFIKLFETSLNPIELSRLIVRISKQFSNLEDALKFLDQICISGKCKKQGGNDLFIEESISWMIIQCEIGHIYLIGNLIKQCKEIIDRITDLLNNKPKYYTQHALYSQYYRICLQYYKTIGSPHKYLDSALKFLTHTTAKDLPQKEQLLFGSDICLAALLSQKCYNFSILLEHELIQILCKTEYNWLYEIIVIFNTGNLKQWKLYCIKYENLLKKHETISNNLSFLEQKIRLMALIELVFQTPAHERLISFATISNKCQLELDEVELVLIRAFSLGLIKGIIDEIDKTVNIIYCVPRSLNNKQINDLENNMQLWIAKIEKCQNEIKKDMTKHNLVNDLIKGK
eukprot:191240_1